MSRYRWVGKGLPRLDGAEKASGDALFGDDPRPPGCLTARLLLSTVPHARIRRLDVSRALRVPGVAAVATAESAAPVRYGRAVADETLFAREKVRFVGERVAAVAAETDAAAEEAVRRIRVEYEPLPAVFTPAEALADGAPRIHEALSSYSAFPGNIRWGNVATEVRVRNGDVEEGFARADRIFEDIYHTPRVHQAYLEPRAAVAEPTPGGVTVYTPTQAAFLVRAVIADVLGLSHNAVRVVCTHVGGGFGGKSHHLIETVPALLCRMTGRPVRLCLSREEDTLTGNPRHAFELRYKTGVARDGRILAREVRLLANNGAYTLSGSGVVAKACVLAPGPYRIPHLKVDGLLVYTNLSPSGSFRGLGGAQPVFACERHMDRIAHELGIDPLALRLANAVGEGDLDPAGVRLNAVSLRETLERAAERAGWAGRRRPAGRGAGGNGSGRIRRGFGIACAIYPTGGRPSGAWVKVNEDGGLAVFAGCSDLGTGTGTVLAQIAAEVLGADPAGVRVTLADTETTPLDAITAASRSVFNAGQAVRLAAEDARAQLLDHAARMLEAAPEDLEVLPGRIALRGAPSRSVSLLLLSTWPERAVRIRKIGRMMLITQATGVATTKMMARNKSAKGRSMSSSAEAPESVLRTTSMSRKSARQ